MALIIKFCRVADWKQMFQPNPEYSRQIVRLSYLVACALIKHVYNNILFLKYAALKRATLGCFGSSELNDLLSEFEAKTLSLFHLRKVERFCHHRR